jgi:hypothetical protein
MNEVEGEVPPIDELARITRDEVDALFPNSLSQLPEYPPHIHGFASYEFGVDDHNILWVYFNCGDPEDERADISAYPYAAFKWNGKEWDSVHYTPF